MSKLFGFVWDNKEWIFSGIGIVVLLGILKILRHKFHKPKTEAPQVIVHVAATEQTLSPDIKGTELKRGPIERISPITFKDIRKTIDAALPLQKDHVRKNFVGIKVEWDSFLKYAYPRKDGMVRLTLGTSKAIGLESIHCEVPLSRYRELGILPEGAKIRIQGTIAEAGSLDVDLNDVTLFFDGD